MHLENRAVCTTMFFVLPFVKKQIFTKNNAMPSAALGKYAFNWNQRPNIVCMLKMNISLKFIVFFIMIIWKGVDTEESLAEGFCFKMLFQDPKLSFLALHH